MCVFQTLRVIKATWNIKKVVTNCEGLSTANFITINYDYLNFLYSAKFSKLVVIIIEINLLISSTRVIVN